MVLEARAVNIHKEKISSMPGILIILTGYTGVGKTVVRSSFLERNSGFLSLVTSTSRDMREGEIDGVDYHFLTREQFEQGIQDGGFVEHALYPSKDGKPESYYGTTKSELNRVLAGENLVSTMEMSGAGKFPDSIRALYDETTAKLILDTTVIVYIEAESIEELKRRFMEERGGNEADFLKRLKKDQELYETYGERFTKRIKNLRGNLSGAILQLENLVNESFPQTETTN